MGRKFVYRIEHAPISTHQTKEGFCYKYVDPITRKELTLWDSPQHDSWEKITPMIRAVLRDGDRKMELLFPEYGRQKVLSVLFSNRAGGTIAAQYSVKGTLTFALLHQRKKNTFTLHRYADHEPYRWRVDIAYQTKEEGKKTRVAHIPVEYCGEDPVVTLSGTKIFYQENEAVLQMAIRKQGGETRRIFLPTKLPELERLPAYRDLDIQEYFRFPMEKFRVEVEVGSDSQTR